MRGGTPDHAANHFTDQPANLFVRMGGSSTPWEELCELAKIEFKGHYKQNPRQMPEAQPEYIDLAINRQYEGDGERGCAQTAGNTANAPRSTSGPRSCSSEYRRPGSDISSEAGADVTVFP